MKKRRGWYVVELEQDNDAWMGTIQELPDIVSMADTIADAVRIAKDSLLVYFKENNDEPLPVNLPVSEDVLINLLLETRVDEKLIIPIYVDPTEFVTELTIDQFNTVRGLCKDNGIELKDKPEDI